MSIFELPALHHADNEVAVYVFASTEAAEGSRYISTADMPLAVTGGDFVLHIAPLGDAPKQSFEPITRSNEVIAGLPVTAIATNVEVKELVGVR